MTLTAANVSKSYNGLSVLSDVSLNIAKGTTVSLVGPSGCGKSTLLNILSGLDRPDSGIVKVDRNLGVAYMMQDSLLLPWRTLAENALLGMEVRYGRAAANPELVSRYFEAFDLASGIALYPSAASGGMKQRVALIRTLLTDPTLLLLDEPFASLDFDVKLKVQRYLIDYQLKGEKTVLLVTHDIEDAIALSDEIIVLSDKPARVKSVIPIDIGYGKHDPVRARKSPRFTEYFTRIWEEIKYLDEE
jgi:NitT/TauT family transport system ATP-binding protein